MIEFNPEKTILPINDSKKAENNQGTESLDFRNVFQQAIGSAETKSQSVEATAHFSDIRPAQFEASTTDVSAEMVVDQIDALIQAMEDYQRELTNGEATLKDMAPIVDKIVRQSDSLSNLSTSDGVDDGLKSIADQSLSLSSQEVAKYKSGVYNDEG